MAAPLAAKILLPDDSANTGKQVRTQTRVVGADTVHEHFFVPISARSKLGMYMGNSTVQAVQASAHNGTTQGFFWLWNPTGGTVKLALRRMEYHAVANAVTVALTTPRLAFALFTATGNASGATFSGGKRDSTDAAPAGSVRSASTGLTVTLGNILYALLPPALITAAGVIMAVPIIWTPLEEEMPVLRAGEGIVCYQPDAGTASDPRRFVVNLVWEEFE